MKKKPLYKKEARTTVNPPKEIDGDKSATNSDLGNSPKPKKDENFDNLTKAVKPGKNGKDNTSDKTKN
jgi:hypothetical protein